MEPERLRERAVTTEVERLAEHVAGLGHDDVPAKTIQRLKLCTLDALGCAIGAQGAGPVEAVRAHVESLGGEPSCTLIGGGRTAPDRAALHNGALVRYLDFNDSYLAPGETCHPSDNLAAVLATAEHADRSGQDVLDGLAVAYHVQCRLCDEAPVRAHGFDHVTHLSYSATAGAAKMLGLDRTRTANALAIAGTAFNALRVTRTGELSHWKGLAAANAASCAVQAALLAASGITGPRAVIEGMGGFRDAISGPFAIDWSSEAPDRAERVVLKRFDAEVHSQSTIEAALELRRLHELDPGSIDRVEVSTFSVARDIIGGTEVVRTKEQADHSLRFLVAIALLDGEVGPRQFDRGVIARSDVQALMERVVVVADEAYSRRFPGEMPSRIVVISRDGRRFAAETRDYEGFHTRPMSWDGALAKFRSLCEPRTPWDAAARVADIVADLERRSARELTSALAMVNGRSRTERTETP